MFESQKQKLVEIALKALLEMAASNEAAALASLEAHLKAVDLPIPDEIETPLDALIAASAKEAYDAALALLRGVVDPPAPAGPPAP